jgi:hypothetical protein
MKEMIKILKAEGSVLRFKALIFSFSLPAMICFAPLLPAHGQSIGPEDVFDQALITERIDSEVLTYRMSQAGDSAGVSVLTYQVDDGALRLYEAAKVMVGGSLFDETIDAKYSFQTKQMEGEEIVIDYGGKRTEMKAQWPARNQIDVQIGALDSTIQASDHIPRIMTLFLLPRLFYDSEDQMSYHQFNLLDLQFRDVTASVMDQTKLDLPLGSCNCYKVELRGGVASQDLYIDPVTHRIVRIEIPDQGWEYDLIELKGL